MDPGASGPNRAADGSGRSSTSRLRRRAPAISGQRRSAATRGPVGHASAASPNAGGTAEGQTFRPGTEGLFDSRTRPRRGADARRATSMTTDTLSLGAAKRLAQSAGTLPIRATRSADLETPIGAFLRLDDGGPAYLLESVEGGERLGRYSFLGVAPRRLLEVRDGRALTTTRPLSVAQSTPDPRTATRDGPDPLDAVRRFVARRRVLPVDGMPRFTGGAVGALAYDAVNAFERTVPLPDRDPVGVPTASFIETDLVLVFDHLTHELSAIASLHTDAADLEGRYRIAERAIFEALHRTARPSAAELGATAPTATASSLSDDRIQTSLGRDEYIHAVERAKDAIAAGEAIQVVLARRQTFDLPAAADGSPLHGITLAPPPR